MAENLEKAWKKQTAAAITTDGYEIERELKKPERQRMVELKRSKERSHHIQMGF